MVTRSGSRKNTRGRTRKDIQRASSKPPPLPKRSSLRGLVGKQRPAATTVKLNKRNGRPKNALLPVITDSDPAFLTTNRVRGRPLTPELVMDSEAEDSKSNIHLNGISPPWTVEGLIGDRPPFSDWAKRAVDKARNRVYVYGGRRQGEDCSRPDLYCCHIANKMTWVNLTDEVKFCNPYGDPFDGSFVPPTSRPLPTLFNPSIAFMSMKNRNFLMLFGGQDEDAKDDGVTNHLIAIDVDELFWFYVPIQVKSGKSPGPPRMNAAMVAVGCQLFIFGGRAGPDCDGYDALDSYSVIRYNMDKTWTWVVPQCEYPSHLPPLGYEPQAVATYGGLKILLLPGRFDNDTPIDIEPDRMVFFHTGNLKFSVANDVAGTFPSGLAWYHTYVINPRRPLPSRKNFGVPSITQGLMGPPSVLICGWSILNGRNPDLSPKLSIELWKYTPTPEDRMECLNVGTLTRQYQQEDFEDALLVGDRLYLLGSKKTDEEWRAADGMDTDEVRRYNVRMEVPLS